MNTKFSVALHMMIFIAETDQVATSEVIATSVNTNSSYLRKLAKLLKNAELIESSQGKSEFVLTREAKDITLAAIYLALYEEKQLLNIHSEPNL